MKSFLKLPNLAQRIVTGLLGSAGIITGLWLGQWTYLAVLFIICLFSLLEFYKLCRLDGLSPLTGMGTIIGTLTFLVSFLVEAHIIPGKAYLALFPLAAISFIITLYRQSSRPFTNVAFTFLGILYTAIPFSLLNIAVFEGGEYHYPIIVGCMFILWASDTGAYFAGTFLGKHKLFERVSPKKTWEGFFGGAILAGVFALLMAHFFELLPVWKWLTLGLIIVVAGTFGDLVESLFKRSIAIKDSGATIPGHGGFLDRFDGLLVASPFIVAFLEFF